MAVPAGLEYVDKGYDIPKLNQFLDWFNLLSYDYHSAFEPSVNHHAPLYGENVDDEYNYDSDLNIVSFQNLQKKTLKLINFPIQRIPQSIITSMLEQKVRNWFLESPPMVVLTLSTIQNPMKLEVQLMVQVNKEMPQEKRVILLIMRYKIKFFPMN